MLKVIFVIESLFAAREKRGARLEILILFILLCAYVFLKSKGHSLELPVVAVDGAYQTASSLFRIDNSQFPGRDFYPYLGVSPIFLLYPLFKAFGSNLAASVLASFFATFVIGFLVLLLGLNLNTEMSFGLVVRMSVLIYLLIDYLDLGKHLYIIHFYQDPGSSLRPIRSFAPYFVLTFYLLISGVLNEVRAKLFALSVVMGIVLTWSNDYAFVTFLVFSVFVLILDRPSIKWFVIFIFLSVASFILWISLLTAFHPIEMLRYNFLDVRQDQWWYFGPYDYGRAWNIIDLLKFDILVIPAILYWSRFFFVSLRYRDRKKTLWSYVGVNLFLGGALTSWIGFYTGYYQPFLFWFVLTLFLELFGAITRTVIRSLESRLFGFIVICLVISAFLHQYTLFLSRKSEMIDRGLVFVEELGGYISEEFIDYINFIRLNRNYNVIEDYFGIWGAVSKKNSNWRVDLIIHALGSQRDEAKKAVQKAEFLITTRRKSSIYFEWIVSQNFWFFEELENFAPHYISPSTIVWKREKDRNESRESLACQIRKIDGTHYSIEANFQEKGYYVIDVDYDYHGARNLLVVRNGRDPANRYVSLNLRAGRFSFPLYISANLPDMYVFGWDNYELNFKGCKFSPLKSPVYENLLYENFFVTDENWIRGIGRRWAGFYLPATQNYITKFRTGQYITLPDGQSRRIVSAEVNGAYLNVFLEGEPLDTEMVPSPLIITGEFFLTDQNWNRGVSKLFPGFFVPNTAYYRSLYETGKKLRSEREIFATS